MNDIRYICPICGEHLARIEKSFVCENNHSFDIARQGYVNLLPVGQKHSLRPGDDKEMLNARRNFLNSGFYEPIANSVTSKIQTLTAKQKAPVIIDVGCGEGYYTRKIADNIVGSHCVGADISKDATRMACSRGKDIEYCVATASHLPFESKSIDVITAMFSLVCEDEFARILRNGGYIVEVTAGTEHLIELKQVIYDEVFPQDKHPAPCGEKFKEISCENFSYKIDVSGDLLKSESSEESGEESQSSETSDSGMTNILLIGGVIVLGIIGFIIFKIKKGEFGNKKETVVPFDDFEEDEEINEDEESKKE